MRGCFGSVLTHKPSSPTCSICHQKDECGRQSMIRTQYLFPSRDSNTPIMEDQIGSRAVVPEQTNSSLSKKSLALMKQLAAKGVTPEQMRENLNQRVNPLRRSRKPQFLWLVFEELVQSGRFEKAEITKRLKEQGMSYSTASSCVSSAVAILKEIGGSEVSRKSVIWRGQ